MKAIRIYIVQSPLSFLISMMDIKKNEYKANEILFLAKNEFSIPPKIQKTYKCLKLETPLYQRLFKKVFSIYIPPLKIFYKLINLYFQKIKIILHCSWMFEEAEYISNWHNYIKHFYLEDGQLGQIMITPYENNQTMRWRKRKKYFKERRSQLSFRKDCAGYLCITEKAYASHTDVPKKIYSNFSSCLAWYSPKLLDIEEIIIAPHPKRLPVDKYLKSVLKECYKLDKRWALKLHWGVYSYKKLYEDIYNTFKKIDPSVGILCDEYTIIEIEMWLKVKHLYGNVTSLAMYAKKFGSSYKTINFEGFSGFKKGENYFMPK